MAHLTINGRNYHVEVSGNGIPILLLHGFTGDTTTWQSIREALEISHTVIAVDILGHGKSDKPNDVNLYRMESVACDLIKLLGTLAVGKVHLLGYSMGGRLALYLAHRFPDKFHSLILESASPGLATEVERQERRARDDYLADEIVENGIDWFVDFWENLSLWESQKSLPDDVLEQQRQQRLRNDPIGLANSLRGMGTGVQPNLWDVLSELSVPTQLIVGEYDRKFVRINAEVVENMPNAEMAIIKGAGHTVHLENPRAFIGQVQEFLATVI